MVRKMIAGVASVLVLAAGPVVAQQAAPQPQATPQTQTMPAPQDRAAYSEVDDMKVYSVGGEQVGEIEEIIIDPQGSLAYVLEIEEGFLGMRETEVIVPADRLMFQGDRFQSRMTEEELKSLQQWD